jgi:A/G-specific adenine glycosylase
MLSSTKKRNLQRNILHWYKLHGRTLPWRGIKDPYRILISEIMLQQTQVSRVLEKYPRFLKRFPTMRALASSAQRHVVIRWQGMGYNNRAVRLHKLAGLVVSDNAGKLPAQYESLRALPGIGRYTANAILSSAFHKPVPVVDINVRRVLSRILWRMRSLRDLKEEVTIWKAAETILPRRSAYRWNQALMDLGATVCTSRAPLCHECPARSVCASAHSMVRTDAKLPRREPSRKGIPNRIYRGKIIQFLRMKDPLPLNLRTIAGHLQKRAGKPDKIWLQSLLRSLEKDGLIRFQSSRKSGMRNIVLA